MLKSKNQLVRELVTAKKYKEALGICKDWDRGILPEDRNSMRLAYECMSSPRFYKELHYDVDYFAIIGVRVLIKYYGEETTYGNQTTCRKK